MSCQVPKASPLQRRLWRMAGRAPRCCWLSHVTREEKKAALVSGMDRLTQRELDSIYMALDMPAQEGDVRAQVSGILSWMKTQERYESSRLRDGRKGIITRHV